MYGALVDKTVWIPPTLLHTSQLISKTTSGFREFFLSIRVFLVVQKYSFMQKNMDKK